MLRKQLKFRRNTLYHGDCFHLMEGWEDGCIDLIYLDPPFNSDANYNVLFGKDSAGKPRDEPAQFTAFKDTWYWNADAARRVEQMSRATAHPAHKAIRGLAEMLPETGMLAYLSYMAERLTEMHRILKDDGSIYLHIDSTASHYLKAIMDCVFDADNFRNEIVWHYNKWTNAAKYFQRNHDVIFWYTKSDSYLFNKQFSMTSHKEKVLERGWDRNVANGTKQLLVYNREKSTDQIKVAKIKDQKIVYMDNKPPGVATPDVWSDINYISSRSRERLGYPTQKPLALLKRIIQTSSNADEIVLDPFCGCGTTIEAAYKLGRNFIGIDISPYAITRLCRERLKYAEDVDIRGLPTNLDRARAMAQADRLLFEQWAVTTLPGFEPNDKQTGDGGIDGRGFMLHPPDDEKGRCVVQVKSGGFTPDNLRALLSKISGGYASMGIFITMEKMGDTPTVRNCVSQAGQFAEGVKTFNRMLFWSIEEHFTVPAQLQLPAMAHPRTGQPLQGDLMIREDLVTYANHQSHAEK